MIYIPKISPVQIKQIAVGSFLAQDLGTEFYGIDQINFCNEIPINAPFIFQIFSDTVTPTVTAGNNPVTMTDITPSGWDGLGSYVYEISYTPTTTDSFQFFLNDGSNFFESTSISVVEDVSHLVKISYMNSDNDFLYVAGSTLSAYFDAEYVGVQPGNEMSVYTNDRGNVTKLRATPTESYELNVYNVPYAVINLLNLIWSCDTVTVNGESFQTEENVNAERIENTNIFNASIVITRTADDYEFYTVSDDGIVLTSDDTAEIISDDNNVISF